MQLRSELVAGAGATFGDHRVRGRWGFGDLPEGGIVPALEADTRVRHGDATTRLNLPGGDMLDIETRVTGWWRHMPRALNRVVDSADSGESARRPEVPWWRNNGTVVPLTATRRLLTRSTADGSTELRSTSISTGLGIDFAEVYQPDGWLELAGFTYARVDIDGSARAPVVRARDVPTAAPTPASQSLDLVSVRALSFRNVVAVDDFDMVAVWDVGIGATRVRDRATGQVQTVVTGRLGTCVRVWEHGTFGALIGQRVRPADTADSMLADLGLHARADVALGRLGAGLRFGASRLTPLFAPQLEPSWSLGAHATGHIALGGVHFGVEHATHYATEWPRYTGAFVRYTLTSTRSAMLQ